MCRAPRFDYEGRTMVKFTWRVAVHGYKWSEVEDRENDRPEYYLEPVDENFHEYAPLDEFTGLFCNFAEINPTKPDILTFANRFGSLLSNFYVNKYVDSI